MARVSRALLVLAVAALASSLLFGNLIHRSSPLLHPACTDDAACCVDRWHRAGLRLRLSLATTSFAAATSARLLIAAPLLRLREKQLLPSALAPVVEGMGSLLDRVEGHAHRAWEEVAEQSGIWNADGTASEGNNTVPLAELSLGIRVPCETELALQALHYQRDPSKRPPEANAYCPLREVLTADLLVEHARAHDDSFDLATHTVLLRDVWPSEDPKHRTPRRLTPHAMLHDATMANLTLPNYFSDATRAGYGALVPDESEITLSRFLQGILTGRTPAAKIGTQVIVEKLPELREEIVPPSIARGVFGWSTFMDDWKEGLSDRLGGRMGRWIRKLPSTSYFPVFIAGMQLQAGTHPRTDLHAEPIGNMASQLHGTRRWTLVPAKWSGLLRPTVSRHRGYFYSNLHPMDELPGRLSNIPVVYECVTQPGDVLWVPPWMWHRVDYDGYIDTARRSDDGEETVEGSRLSVGASIFHLYPWLYFTNPLFGFLIVPNLILEVLGFNVE